MHSACVTRVLAHRREHRGQIAGELREIEVAVGVDEHRDQSESGIRGGENQGGPSSAVAGLRGGRRRGRAAWPLDVTL